MRFLIGILCSLLIASGALADDCRQFDNGEYTKGAVENTDARLAESIALARKLAKVHEYSPEMEPYLICILPAGQLPAAFGLVNEGQNYRLVEAKNVFFFSPEILTLSDGALKAMAGHENHHVMWGYSHVLLEKTIRLEGFHEDVEAEADRATIRLFGKEAARASIIEWTDLRVRYFRSVAGHDTAEASIRVMLALMERDKRLQLLGMEPVAISQ